MAIEKKILAYFSQFLPDLSLIILISRDHGCQIWISLISPGFSINFGKSHLKNTENYGQKPLVGH